MGKHTNRSVHQSGTGRATVAAIESRLTSPPTQPMTVVVPEPQVWGWTAEGEWAYQLGGTVVRA